MSYEIIIKKTVSSTTVKQPQWETLDHKQVENELKPGEVVLKPIKGYTPEVQQTSVTTVKIYRQMVDDMDLNEVIKAINNL